MPCPRCSSSGEPLLRRPRRFSAEWYEDPATYFGCPSCGHLLARLAGPAANRSSDVPIDRLPDPAGMIRDRFLPELQKTLESWAFSDGSFPELSLRLVDTGRKLGSALGITQTEGLRLPGQRRIIPALVLVGLGRPWLVGFCEVPGEVGGPAPGDLEKALALDTVEAVVRVSIREEGDWLRLALEVTGSEETGSDFEGTPVPVRRRPEGRR